MLLDPSPQPSSDDAGSICPLDPKTFDPSPGRGRERGRGRGRGRARGRGRGRGLNIDRSILNSEIPSEEIPSEERPSEEIPSHLTREVRLRRRQNQADNRNKRPKLD